MMDLQTVMHVGSLAGDFVEVQEAIRIHTY